MKDASLKAVAAWLRTTDLVEVAFRRGQEALALSLEDAPFEPSAALAGCALTPVLCRELGLFRWGRPGTAGRVEKGDTVAEGQVLGLVESGAQSHPVLAPAAGRVVSAQIDDGEPVEYGQALFFLQPS